MTMWENGNNALKVQPMDHLVTIVETLKTEHKKIVHCHGVFDLIHPGHMAHFEAAKNEGDVLVVTVTPDEYVNKGPGRPVFNANLRARSVAALHCVDYVAVNQWATAEETIRILKPDVYVKGSDYKDLSEDPTGNIRLEVKAAEEVGGSTHFTDEVNFSSSNLINNYFNPFPPETKHWIKSIRDIHSCREIMDCLEEASKLNVLVVGEAIIDEYVFCDGLGKSSKDPILAFKYRSTEQYAGGSLAVANHIADFCNQVGLVSLVGDPNTHQHLFRDALSPNIQPYFLPQTHRPTIQKRRFVDAYTKNRLFEIYVMDDSTPSPDVESDLIKTLSTLSSNYDLIIVTDYGHGMMSPRTIDCICSQPQYLAVNTQANAGNRGFNTISKYPRADYVCLAANEVALETRLRHAGWKELMLEVMKRIPCKSFCMTRGQKGSLRYDPNGGFTEAPAFAIKVTDRVGAGDAFFAVTAMMEKIEAPPIVSSLIGNLAGAEIVGELGNKISVSKASLEKHITSLLK